MRPVKRLLAGLLLALGLAAGALVSGALAADGWTPWRNDEFGVSIAFPGQPIVTREEDKVEGTPVVRMIAHLPLRDDGELMLWATRYQGGIPDPDAAVTRSADNIVAGPNLQLISRTHTQVQGAPAEDLLLFNSKEGYQVAALLVIKDGVLYQMLTVGSGKIPPETFPFRDSFTLLPSAASRLESPSS